MELFAEIIRLSTVEGTNPFSNNDAAKSIWQQFLEVADSYNEPHRFHHPGWLRVDFNTQGRQPAPRGDVRRRCG